MTRPRLLDLFCGAGGAGMGYYRAGFDVTGIDINPQPRYPFTFVQADAIAVMAALVDGDLIPLDEDRRTWLGIGDLAAIHASPPCQDHMKTPTHNQAEHGTGWMLATTRELLTTSGLPWVIENVPGAAMRPDIELCGCMFPELRTRSKRWFETSWQAFDLIPAHDHSREVLNRREVATAMGIDWMSGSEHQQAIPPAYTEYIGGQLLEHIHATAA